MRLIIGALLVPLLLGCGGSDGEPSVEALGDSDGVLYVNGSRWNSCCLSFSATAGQVRYPTLAGPLWLKIGKPATLYARDFPAHRTLFISLERGRDSVGAQPCCVSTITAHPRTDSSGSAVIRFTWPRTYPSLPRGCGRWRESDVALVYVVSEGWHHKSSNPDSARATNVVYLRGKD